MIQAIASHWRRKTRNSEEEVESVLNRKRKNTGEQRKGKAKVSSL